MTGRNLLNNISKDQRVVISMVTCAMCNVLADTKCHCENSKEPMAHTNYDYDEVD